MCSRTTCKKCAKPTWKGCGNHIEQALAGVAKGERCACGTNAGPSTEPSRGGLFSRRRSR